MSQNKLIDHSQDIVIYRGSDIFSYIMNRYIQTYDDFVYKDDYGKYVFTKLMADRNIMASFYLFLTEMVNSDILPLGEQSTFIVTGTYPFLNWRRSMYDNIKSPKSQRIINHQMLLNYVMTDRTIKLDETHLCRKLNEWINTCMCSPDDLASAVNIADNIKFMYNRNTSERDLINIIMAMYGESRVTLSRPNTDYIKSVEELNEYVYMDIPKDHMIPKKIIDESVYYLNLQLNRELDDGGVGDDSEENQGEESAEDYTI